MTLKPNCNKCVRASHCYPFVNPPSCESFTPLELCDTAIDACKEINPDNPLAVAENIGAMYKALKQVWNADLEMSQALQAVIQLAINEAEGK